MAVMATDAAMREGLLHVTGLPLRVDVPLGERTWYGVGGAAAVLGEPESLEQLAALVRWARGMGLMVRVLGKGANLLVPEGTVGGVVVALDRPAFRTIQFEGNTAIAGGGADFEKLITGSVRQGLAGLEGLAGVPATVGGAVRMNAGGAYGQTSETLASVTVVESDGEVRTLGRDELEFGYRYSNLGERIVVEARFELTPAADAEALRRRLVEVMGIKKRSQPMAARSAGCAFKNPKDQSDKGAGWLIERAGLKGYRVGGAEVSAVHANFIVLHPGGTAADVLAVMRHVAAEVERKLNIHLEREVVVWDTQQN